jgi:N4-gp56 family major capsid protein
MFSTPINIGHNNSDTVVKARVERLGTGNLSPLNSISYNESDKLVETPYTITAKSYEKTIKVSYDVIELHENSKTLNEGIGQLRKSLEETLDQISRDALDGARSYLCTDGTVAGTITEPLEGDFLNVETILLENDAPKITQIIMPTDKVATESVEEAYIGLCHTKLGKTLRGVINFKSTNNYSDPNQRIMNGEIGSIGPMRILTSSRGKIYGDGTIPIYILGSGAYHTLKIGSNIFNIKQDPEVLDKFTSAGYRVYFGARITQPLNIIKMICKPLT